MRNKNHELVTSQGIKSLKYFRFGFVINGRNTIVKDQDLTQIETAVNSAKKAGIEIVHGFFIYGSPDETEEDMRQTFRFAAKLRIDTYSFNDLCIYRGTPLWNEYIQRGLVDEEKDWDAYFACTSIDPTVLPREKIIKILAEEKWRMMAYKVLRYPLQSLRALRRFARHMPIKDLIQLMARPFLRIIAGVTRAEPVSPADEYHEVKSAAADLPQVSDDQPQAVIADSQVDEKRLSA